MPRNKTLRVMLPLALTAASGCSAIPVGPLAMREAPRPTHVGSVRIADLTDSERMVVRRVHVDAPREAVFARMTDFESMPEWLPGLHAVHVDNAASENGSHCVGVGTVRTCDATGATVEERVLHYDAPNAFAYQVVSSSGPAMPASEGTGVVSLTPTRDGGTDVEYYVFFETKSWHPMSPVFATVIGKQLGEGLDNLADHFQPSVAVAVGPGA